jgi:FkbM family methyltransferase
MRRQRMRGGAIVELDLSDRLQSRAYFAGQYAPEIVAAITTRLPHAGTFFDIGSNIGLVSFSVAARRPDVTIHAFEPVPQVAAQWRANHLLNPQAKATLTEMAVGEVAGTAELQAGVDSGTGITLNHREPDPGRTVIEVPQVTLDDHADAMGVDRIDMMKVDVEGHEPFVLQGSECLLTDRRIGAIVCELNDWHLQSKGWDRQRLIGWMQSHGYQAVPVQPVGLRRLRDRKASLDQRDDVVFLAP